MLDESTTTDEKQTETTGADSGTDSGDTPSRRPRRRRAASRPAGPPEATDTDSADASVTAPTSDGKPAGDGDAQPAKEIKPADEANAAVEVKSALEAKPVDEAKPADEAKTVDGAASTADETEPAAEKRTTRKRTAKKDGSTGQKTAKKAAARKKTSAKKAAAKKATSTDEADGAYDAASDAAAAERTDHGVFAPIFQAPDPTVPAPKRERADDDEDVDKKSDDSKPSTDGDDSDTDEGGSSAQRRRRRRGGRRRRKPAGGSGDADDSASADDEASESSDGADTASGDTGADTQGDGDGASGTRRRRRRRRRGEEVESSPDDPENTVVRVREPRGAEDEITALEGSTRMEAKKQRRREGRAAGRRRAPIVSEAEFLARRESVNREMVVRQRADVTQIAVLEDSVLVEHYVARESQTSLIGNVYLGRVQNVLPSMEAAFIDIGKGRNAVLYAGEVDWNALGMEGKPHRIEDALKSGQTVLVQVTKDPVGHKGARLTGQISLPGRFLVYVPAGHTSGISRKLPDTERTRLKDLLKQVLPDDAGVIVRTAAEGATEEQLNRDVTALTARWDDIRKKSESNQAPQLLYAEPDLMLKVVRDLFNEDFSSLVIDGDDAWDTIEAYVSHVAPDLADRVRRWTGGDTSDGGDGEAEATEADREDVFAGYRIDEQIAKALERKVWLPSGGSLVIDRTEAMTVIDVNTGKFTGSGGNLEETVTKNNLEAAEEVVRQLRLRDIGGIIVIDFIDMVLESNRDLVLRRLVECLGRDRTRHQVAEVTSLGLVQMTRKRIGTGLLEAFSEPCEHCKGRGVILHQEPIEPKPASEGSSSRRRGKRGGSGQEAKSTKKSSSRRKSGNGSSEAKNDKPSEKAGKSSGKAARPSEKADGSTSKADKPTDSGTDVPIASSDRPSEAPQPADTSA